MNNYENKSLSTYFQIPEGSLKAEGTVFAGESLQQTAENLAQPANPDVAEFVSQTSSNLAEIKTNESESLVAGVIKIGETLETWRKESKEAA